VKWPHFLLEWMTVLQDVAKLIQTIWLFSTFVPSSLSLYHKACTLSIHL